MHEAQDHTAVNGGAHRYLVIRGPEAGQCRSFVSAFTALDEAEGAFMAMRRSESCRAGWVELVAIDPSGRLKVLAWFGRPAPPVTADALAWSTERGATDERGDGRSQLRRVLQAVLRNRPAGSPD